MKNRGQFAFGIILILLGVWYIAEEQVPAVQTLTRVYMSYPLNLIVLGGLMLLVGLVVGAPGLAVPALVLAGVGAILYYQKVSGDYSSWSFMWTLIPGFVGVGEVIHGLLSKNGPKARSGGNLLVFSAVMFVLFASLFGRLAILGPYGPAILLILVGVLVLVRGIYRKV